MPAPSSRPETVQERILRTARELFYAHGIRAVGVDTIIREADVAKSSLYRWYPGKDDLVAAFLASEDADFWAQWDAVAAAVADPRQQLLAQLDWIGRYVGHDRFRGCPFLNATAEFPDSDHPARVHARAHKLELRRRLSGLLAGAGAPDPEGTAEVLALLIDGALVDRQVLGRNASTSRLRESADVLLAAHGI